MIYSTMTAIALLIAVAPANAKYVCIDANGNSHCTEGAPGIYVPDKPKHKPKPHKTIPMGPNVGC